MATPAAFLAFFVLPWDALAYPALGGYMPVNNVHEHTEIIKDVLAIEAALQGEDPDFATATDIYERGTGKSCKSPTQARTLQGFAQKDLTGESFADRFVAGGFDVAFWDPILLEALSGTGVFEGASRTKRVTSINKMIIGLVTYYTSHELEASLDKIAAEGASDSGSALAWDEGWAFYYGSEEGGAGAPYGAAAKRDDDFKDGDSVSSKILRQFNAGLHYVRPETADDAKAKEAMEAIYKMWAITYIRAGLKYLEISESTYGDKSHAEGYAYFMAIDGFVASYDADAAKAMRDALEITQSSIPSGSFCAARGKMYKALPKMGISCEMLGSFVDSSLTCSETCESSTVEFPAGREAEAAMTGTATNMDCVPPEDEEPEPEISAACQTTHRFWWSSASLVAVGIFASF